MIAAIKEPYEYMQKTISMVRAYTDRRDWGCIDTTNTICSICSSSCKLIKLIKLRRTVRDVTLPFCDHCMNILQLVTLTHHSTIDDILIRIKTHCYIPAIWQTSRNMFARMLMCNMLTPHKIYAWTNCRLCLAVNVASVYEHEGKYVHVCHQCDNKTIYRNSQLIRKLCVIGVAIKPLLDACGQIRAIYYTIEEY